MAEEEQPRQKKRFAPTASRSRKSKTAVLKTNEDEEDQEAAQEYPTRQSPKADTESSVQVGYGPADKTKPSRTFGASSTSAGDEQMIVPQPSIANKEPCHESPMDLDDELNSGGVTTDVVAREIDLFLKPNVDPLYVLQYDHRYLLDERCEEVRLKPATSQLELDLSKIQDAGCSSDRKMKNPFRLNATKKYLDALCGRDRMKEKQTLHTKWETDRPIGYTVGIFMRDKLYLNRVHKIVQLRPYIRDAEVDSKMDEPLKQKSIISSSKQSEVEQPQYDQKAEDEKQWLRLSYQGCKSDASEQYLLKMIGDIPLQFTMLPDDYIDSLCPRSASHPNDKRNYLLTRPLKERLKELLSEERPLRFSVVQHYAPDISVEGLLEMLQRDALLVQGLWVAKSSLRDRNPARDYVLRLFSQSRVISFAQVDDAGNLKEAVKVFLRRLAVERPLFKDWKFKEDPDQTFIKHYPDIVKKQEQIWRTRQAQEAMAKNLEIIFAAFKVCSLELVCQGLCEHPTIKNDNPTADLLRIAAEGLRQFEPEFLEVLNHAAIEVQDDRYVWRFPKYGKYNSLRGVVIDLLREKGKIKRADVVKAAAREIPNKEYTKVMSDLCTCTDSWWVLKEIPAPAPAP